MTATRSRSGQPLVVLGGLLVLWVMARVLLWQSPFPAHLPPLPDSMFERWPTGIAHTHRSPWSRLPAAPAGTQPRPAPLWPVAASRPVPFFEPGALASRGQPFDETAAHQLMWLASLTDRAAPSAPYVNAASWPGQDTTGPALATPAPGETDRANRWSLAAWMFLRQGGLAASPVGAGPAVSYGASQAGGVLRYRLAQDSPWQPEAYVRVTAALDNTHDRELAAGLAVRPMAGVPVALMGEGRIRARRGAAAVRPAVLAVTEIAPQALPGGLAAELYLQGGYVGGPDATAFADGQLRVTGALARFERATLRAGGGAWAGAQRGAARVDIGPTAQLDLSLGVADARLALDYRVRVSGQAAPDTGLALTLSTGF